MIDHLQQTSCTYFDVVLMLCSHFGTSDPRDRIYVTLGIMDLSKWPNRLLDLIQPDYTLPVKVVYTLATVAAIQSSGRLPVLRWAHIYDPRLRFRKPEALDEDSYGVPSWVPRYDLGSHVTMALASSSIRGCDAELQA
jgi:hypothetical protein